MFDKLDDIDWESYKHAYGPAEDVPHQLRALVSPIDSHVQEALQSLWCNIHHQGTVYEAAIPAIPFLIAAIELTEPPVQAELMRLLGALAFGGSYHEAHQDILWLREAWENNETFDLEGRIHEERDVVLGAAQAVCAGWAVYIPRLRDTDISVRLAAVFLTAQLAGFEVMKPNAKGWLPAFAAARVPGLPAGAAHADLCSQLTSLYAAEPLAIARAGLLEALGVLGALEKLGLTAQNASELSAVEAFSLSRALMAHAQEDAQRAAVEPLAAKAAWMYDDVEAEHSAHSWPWDSIGARAVLLQMGAQMPDEGLQDFGIALAQMLSKLPGIPCEHDVLRAALGPSTPNIPDDPCLLSPGRRAIALALAEDEPRRFEYVTGNNVKRTGRSQCFWDTSNGNASLACQQIGAPHDRSAWLRWLNQGREKTPRNWGEWLKRFTGG